MKFLSSSDLLNLWERGFGLHPLDQALLILGEGFPDASYESLADWPLGRRNHALVELRCACFGPRLRSWMTCPNCGERLEFEMDGRTFTRGASDTASNDLVVVNGQSFRLPTSRDLAHAMQERDPAKAAIRLIESCRTRSSDAPAQTKEDLTDEELEEVGQSMSLADPLAEILIDLRCPLCGNESNENLDVASFFWTEIEAQAKQLLFAVHTLASKYGWTENEVLSLSEHRRAFYLEMVHE